MNLKLISSTSQTTKVAVKDEIFGLKPNDFLLSQAIRVYLANLRQDTSKVKTRSEINRTKKKWFKQKGTGNARHGARTPNIFVGGGVSHGPNGNQTHRLKLPHQLKLQALKLALSAQKDQTSVHDELINFKGKTKEAAQVLAELLKVKRLLVVLATEEISQAQIRRSLSNLKNVLLISARQLTALEVSLAGQILFSKMALKELENRLIKKAA